MAAKLVIGYAPTERGDDALALGALLAQAFDATPVVATVVGYPGYLTVSADVQAELERQTEPLFARARQRIAPLEPEVRTLFDDSPGYALHKLAEAEEPIAVAVGSAHRGTLGRILLGSVGQALLSGAPCAVAVAPPGYGADGERRIERIGVGVADSSESRSAVREATALAQRLGARLALIAVAPPIPADIAGAILSMFSRDEIESSEGQRLAAVLERVSAEAPEALPVRRLLRHGDPATVLAEEANDLDLLIVGSRRYGPVRRALLGSVSSRMIRESPAPVLVIPRGGDGRAGP